MLTPAWMFGPAWQLHDATYTVQSAYLRPSKDETMPLPEHRPVVVLTRGVPVPCCKAYTVAVARAESSFEW